MRTAFKALILDMDGVIVDTEPYNMDRVYRYVQTFRPETPVEEMYQIVGRSSQDVWSRIAGIIGGGRSWQETKADYEHNWKPFHPYPVAYPDIFRPETKDVLQWARGRGMLTAVASSTAYDKVRGILAEVGVLSLLDMVVSGESVERSKPDPAIYLKTAMLLGVSPVECLAVEDSTIGITAASQAGITVVALRDDRFDFDRSLAHGVIDRLDHLISYLPPCRQRNSQRISGFI